MYIRILWSDELFSREPNIFIARLTRQIKVFDEIIVLRADSKSIVYIGHGAASMSPDWTSPSPRPMLEGRCLVSPAKEGFRVRWSLWVHVPALLAGMIFALCAVIVPAILVYHLTWGAAAWTDRFAVGVFLVIFIFGIAFIVRRVLLPVYSECLMLRRSYNLAMEKCRDTICFDR